MIGFGFVGAGKFRMTQKYRKDPQKFNELWQSEWQSLKNTHPL